MKDERLIPNAPILVESTRSIGYSFESALADIIDNSVGNGAKCIDVFFDSSDNPFLCVLDDGIGMSKTELIEAMKYGSKSSLDSRDEKDLGRFGLGMKVASLSQCRKLTVISKKNGNISGVCWDLNHIIKTNDWMLKVFDEEKIRSKFFVDELDKYESGTLVIWEDFDRLENSSIYLSKSFDNKIEIARNHISLVFHRFINDENIANRIKIFFNKDIVEAIDPFLITNPATQHLKESTIPIEGQLIKVKPFILPYQSKLSVKEKNMLEESPSLKLNQGFYVYRNKRLIIWGTWFRLIKSQELRKLTRIRVDIPNSLDFIWGVDIKKSSASLPDSIKKSLESIVNESVKNSENVYKYRGRKVSSDVVDQPWVVLEKRGQIKYQVNRESTLYKQIQNNLNEEYEGHFDTFINLIEDLLPFEDMYYRISKSGIDVIKKMDDEEAYRCAIDIIDLEIQSGKSIENILENLEKIEFFKKNPDTAKKIREDYFDGK